MKMRTVTPYLIYGMMFVSPTSNAEETKVSSTPSEDHKKTYTTVQSSPTIIQGRASGYDVIYVLDDSSKIIRSGGTRAWRNSNPGNLRYTEKSRKNGAIGHAGGFAIFPDKETGTMALAELLKSDSYRNLSISDAIFKYAPPHENDTQAYKKQIKKMTGLDIEAKIHSLTPEQLRKVIDAICIIEGWKAGTETKNVAQMLIAQKNLQRA